MNKSLDIYGDLQAIASAEYPHLISRSELIGPLAAKKLRFTLVDGSILDVWLSRSGKYSFHWERRYLDATIYRFDNAPDHPEVATFPHHLHHGKQEYVVESHLSPDLACAFRQVLDFIAAEMAGG